MFLNLTNHPSAGWSEAQLMEAQRRWGQVEDLPFPAVNPRWEKAQLIETSNRLLAEVSMMAPEAVLCQGQTALTCLLVAGFQRLGIPVYEATSDRVSTEEVKEDGTVQKRAIFRFIMFREYPDLMDIEVFARRSDNNREQGF